MLLRHKKGHGRQFFVFDESGVANFKGKSGDPWIVLDEIINAAKKELAEHCIRETGLPAEAMRVITDFTGDEIMIYYEPKPKEGDKHN